MSEETKEKLREKFSGKKNPFYGKHHTEESIQKMKEHLPNKNGEKNPFYGKHHTEESKQKISKSKQGQGSKVIHCITTNEFFDSIREASKKYNIVESTISQNCHKKRKSAGKHPITKEKMIWEFIIKEDNQNEILS